MSFKKSGIVFALIFYLFLFLHPSFPSAHAYIKKSTPSENETLSKPPENVTIEFDEPIQPSYHSIEVFDSEGNRVDQKNGHIDTKNSSIIECDLNDTLPNGTYRIKWRVVSSDGHPVQGVIPFQIGDEGNNQESSNINQESKGYTPEWDLLSIRWLQYVSNACLVGALFFYMFILHKELGTDLWVKDAVRKIVKFSFLTLSLSILLSLPLQVTIESGLPWSEVLSIPVLREMIENTLFGKTWIIQIDCLFLLCISTYMVIKKRLDSPILLWITFILGIGLLLSKSFTSHAAASTNIFFSISLDFLHLVSASIWIGSLLTLATLIPLSKKKESKTLFLETIKRFSKWGIVLVIILAATGFMSSLSYIPNLRTLVSTEYGRVLSGKILLFLMMIVFAMANFLKGKRRRETGWKSTIWGELTPGLIVLGLSVLLSNLPTAMASPGPFKETKTIQEGTRITFEATPNVIGENSFVVWVKDEKGKPISNIEQVTLTFTSLEMDMGEDSKIVDKISDGKYGTKGLNFNMTGQWNVQVHVLTKDLETLDTHFKVLVGSK
ncbi:copper resistance CopC/CopD family protein [Neobacillus drentensis]|uniref:copper resistance CopC/CopD family protein n=1 Tax=Neobacillus drentensis TaxID=220684 RepID=UPI0030003FDC